MEQNILIAESNKVLRVGLRTIFMSDPRVAKVYEAANQKELQARLHFDKLDLVVVNEALITEITLLPKRNLVILVNQPNIKLLKAAYKHGARGYLSINVSAELLLTTLNQSEDSFLIEPTLSPIIMEHVIINTSSCVRDTALSPREKEIVLMLQEGLDRVSIAQTLNITDMTLKTHLKNIAKKGRQKSIIPFSLKSSSIRSIY